MLDRYKRQILLEAFGREGQSRLQKASVLVIGAGGLGCPALLYLTAAGIGKIGIADGDDVDPTNLNRQVLYDETDIGQNKAGRAALKLRKFNPEIDFHVLDQRLTNRNALEIIGGVDMVLDCTDDMTTRYIINDACVLLSKPFVFGAISKYEGQLALFNIPDDHGRLSTNLRDLFPPVPETARLLNCEMEGVIGFVPGIIGTYQAGEAIKLLAGLGSPAVDQLQLFHFLRIEQYTLQIVPRKDTENAIPADKQEFRERDYEQLCHTSEALYEIDWHTLESMPAGETIQVIDIRTEPQHSLTLDGRFHCLHIPFPHLKQRAQEIRGDHIVIVCQSGQTSLAAARWLDSNFKGKKKIYSLKEGVEGLKAHG